MYSKILDISKRRGIVYPSFEIYGGVSGFYDYGPMGSRIKHNIEELIRRHYLIDENFYEVECPTLSPEDIWIASGHIENFADVMTECLKCGEPYRADHLVEEHLHKSCDGLSPGEIRDLIVEHDVRCPKCEGELDKLYDYDLMFGTQIGPGKYKQTAYLRPETAQTTYLAFKRLWEIARRRLPFGVLQIGKSFRNEISPRQGMLRLREFNQAEIQFFVDPSNKDDLFGIDDSFENDINIIDKNDEELSMKIKDALDKGVIKSKTIAYFLVKSLVLFFDMGIDPGKLRLRQHKDEERAFYSEDTWDIEFMSDNFGRVELVGVSDRTDYDLSAHMKLSKEDMQVNLEGRKFVPHVIEIAYGIDRPVYCVLESCYVEDDRGAYFKFPMEIAPYTCGVFPLVRKDGIPRKAGEVLEKLKQGRIYAFYDKAGSIGKRYARADEIGVPFCITVDYDTMKDDTVTVRERDTKEQKRVKIDELVGLLTKYN